VVPSQSLSDCLSAFLTTEASFKKVFVAAESTATDSVATVFGRPVSQKPAPPYPLPAVSAIVAAVETASTVTNIT
jgi:hypothetical protein